MPASDAPSTTAKPGQKTLASLDEYRYETALKTFGSVESDVAMGLDDVETLVEWKLYVSFPVTSGYSCRVQDATALI